MWQKIKKIFLDWWKEEYKVTVWYTGGTEFDPQVTKRIYRMKSVSVKKANHLVGVKTNGETLEIKTVGPFDYQIEKIH